MVELLREILTKTPGVDGWKISERKSEGQELFFVGRNLDMGRSKKVRHIALTVYHDFQEGGRPYRGSVTSQIQPTHTRGELTRIVKESVFAAGFVKNAPYPLPEPPDPASEPGFESLQSLFDSRPLKEWLEPLTMALFKEDTKKEGGINSAELFLNRNRMRILNSAGVDVQYGSYEGLLELISEWQGESEEVELYKEILFSDFQPQLIAQEVKKQLSLSRERSLARPTPSLKNPQVLLTGEAVIEFFHYYLTQSSAKSVYERHSTLKPGGAVQGEHIKGDLLSLKLLPYLPNSPFSAPCDEDGYMLLPVSIIEQGFLTRYWGPFRYTHYLGSEPTGNLKNVSVAPGNLPAAKLRTDSYLEIVSFSDFCCDPLTADFGGEIRLGFLGDGKNRRPVSGGSLSGNIREVQQELYLSQEVQRVGSFLGPETIRLSRAVICGAD